MTAGEQLQHYLERFFALRQHGVDVVLQGRRHAGAALRRDLFFDVGGVEAVSYTHLTLPTNREV